MAISDHVRSQLFSEAQLIRIPQTRSTAKAPASRPAASARSRHGTWTRREHALFLEALDMFPAGPWKAIAEHIGSKTPRQAMTHGQKYRQKIQRRQRGLKKHVRDLDDEQDDDQDDEQCRDDSSEIELEIEIEALVQADAAPEVPLTLSDEDFAAFIASLDARIDDGSDSPLFVPTPAAGTQPPPLDLDDGFALDGMAPVDEAVAAPCMLHDLMLSSPAQQMNHLAVMMRADVTSEESVSPMLLAALHRSNPTVSTIETFDVDAMELQMGELDANAAWQAEFALDQVMPEPLEAAMDGLEWQEPLDDSFLLS